MNFAIVVLGAPSASQASLSALRFSEAVLAQGHGIYRVFFYQDGVQAGSSLAAPPQDEVDIQSSWQLMAADHQVELISCIASCLRRGVINEVEAERYEKPASNLAPGFEISGLGQLIDAALSADQIVTFGA